MNITTIQIAKSVKRTTRELTPIERIQHADIIGR